MKLLWQVRLTAAVYKALRHKAIEAETSASALATEIIGKALGIPKSNQKPPLRPPAQG